MRSGNTHNAQVFPQEALWGFRPAPAPAPRFLGHGGQRCLPPRQREAQEQGAHSLQQQLAHFWPEVTERSTLRSMATSLPLPGTEQQTERPALPLSPLPLLHSSAHDVVTSPHLEAFSPLSVLQFKCGIQYSKKRLNDTSDHLGREQRSTGRCTQRC